MNFDKAFDHVVGLEGGYVDDAFDPGGVTKYGISKRCVSPASRVLTADLNWVRADSLQPGDKLLAFDEVPERRGKLNVRRFRVATVDAVGMVRLPASRIVTENREIIASDDHQWLRRWGSHKVFEWAKTSELLNARGKWTNGVDVRIGTLCAPWDVIQSRDAGYLAGVLDGEGSISTSLEFAQKTGNALVEQALEAAGRLGIEFKRFNERHGVSTYRMVGNGEPFSHVVTAAKLGANRLVRIAANKIIGKSIASTLIKHDKVIAVEPVGAINLIAVSTSTKTLIVDGYLSHNSYPDEDIASLTLERAKELYRQDYWRPLRCDEMPWPLAMLVFDCGVNQGIQVAAKTLQKALGVVQDGSLGKITMTHARNAGMETCALFLADRALRYTGTRNFDRFGRGWLKRLFMIAMEA